MYVYIYIYIYRVGEVGWVNPEDLGFTGSTRLRHGLYTILRLPILYGAYCNKRGSGENNTLRTSVGDAWGEWGA